MENGKGRDCKQRFWQSSHRPGVCPCAVCILPPSSFSCAFPPKPCLLSLSFCGSRGPLSPISVSSPCFPCKSLLSDAVNFSTFLSVTSFFLSSPVTAVLSAQLQPLQGAVTFPLTLSQAPLTRGGLGNRLFFSNRDFGQAHG